MPIPITVPRLGWTMDEGVFDGWLKAEGDLVQAGDALFGLEGEKASQDVEAIDSGILRIPPNSPKPGDVVPVGAILGYLFAPGETPAWEGIAQESIETSAARPAPRTSDSTIESSAPLSMSTATRADPRDESRPVLGKTTPTISPRALRVAQELAVDWTQIRGTGSTGRVRERDVRCYFERNRVGGSRANTDQQRPATLIGGRVEPLSPARKTIATRLRAAVDSTIPVTLVTEIDVTKLVELRLEFQQTDQMAGAELQLHDDTRANAIEFAPRHLVPTFTDFIVKLTATALEQHPMLMAQWTDQGLFIPGGIHINVAVETEAGLVAPLIRDVQYLTLHQLAGTTRMLIELAHARRLTADQSASGTFTVSNLGMYGIDAFTPILNIPQSAILGIGRIRRVPAVVQDQIVPRDRITLSLTFDHRVIDGVPAAKFLDTLRGLLESPTSSEGMT